METLQHLFLNCVKKYSSRWALKMRPRWRTIRWKYKDLDNYARGIAAILEKHNVGLQDRVIIISPNSPYWTGSFWGIMLRGAIAIPLNPQSTESFIRRIVEETQTKVILTSGILPRFDIGIPVIEIDLLQDLTRGTQEYTHVNVNPEHIAEIVYTSGTTGDPKGVVLTHRNIMSNYYAVKDIFPLSESDRTISVLPLFHMFEQMTSMIMALSYGIEIMFAHALSSRVISQCMQEQRVTKMIMVPEMLETIIRKIEGAAAAAGKKALLDRLFAVAQKLPYFLRRVLFRRALKRFGGKLKVIVSGGAALPIEVERTWNALGLHVLQGYGLTETSPVATTNSLEHHEFGSVGLPVSSVTITIAPDGEILMKGESVFKEYWQNAARTLEAFDEAGNFKTGDLGYFDQNGFLFINGRKKYVIVGSSGENIYPDDIEAVLKHIPTVIDAAVIGVQHNGREIVHATLLGDIADASTIIEQANAKLASYQRIQDWAVWPEADFPRSATRKIKKEEIKKWLFERKEGEASNPNTVVIHSTPLARLLSEVTGVSLKKILSTSLLTKDLHLDSLMRIELVGRIEEHYDVIIDEHAITQKTTVQDLEQIITTSTKGVTKVSPRIWLIKLPARIIRAIMQWTIVFPLYRFWIKITPVGLEHLKTIQNTAIFMPNHISFMDAVIVLRALPGRFRRKIALAAALDFLYKEHRFAVRIIEFVFNTFPFPRTESDNIKPGLEYMGKLLDHDCSILLFPEGRISDDGTLQPLKLGAGLVATEMNVPIVPVILSGVRDIANPFQVLPKKRGEVFVRFGEPLHFTPKDSYVDATKQIEHAMQELVEG